MLEVHRLLFHPMPHYGDMLGGLLFVLPHAGTASILDGDQSKEEHADWVQNMGLHEAYVEGLELVRHF